MAILTAYDINGNALFVRYVKDLHTMRRAVLLHPWLVKVDRVLYKAKRYDIKTIYQTQQKIDQKRVKYDFHNRN